MANRVNVLTHIKNQVAAESSNKAYQNFHIKKIDNYYSLYMSKIVFIQRTYRNRLAKKTKYLQANCLMVLQSLKQNKNKNSNLKAKLQGLKAQHSRIENYDQEHAIKNYRIFVQQKLRNAMRNVLNSADIFSKNNAMIKSQILTFEQIKKQNQQLEQEHQSIQNEYFFHQQKLKKWKAKLNDLRNSISYEKNQINYIQAKIKRKAEQSTRL